MLADNPLDGSQTNPGTWILQAGMQPLERLKQFILVLHIEADPIILDEIDRLPFLFGFADPDPGPGAFAGILPGILSQVSQSHSQESHIAFDNEVRLNDKLGLPLRLTTL